MKNYTQEQIAVAIVKKDFVEKFNNALAEAGGMDFESCKGMTVREFADILGPNGIRICYDGEGTLSRKMADAGFVCRVLPYLEA